jgi:precorrin-2 dehydrogenase/sirohydrochlorin ferrochelatase
VIYFVSNPYHLSLTLGCELCYKQSVKTYPLNLIGLDERKVIVIGGGSVSARKVSSLIDAGAHPVVISPEYDAAIRDFASAGSVRLVERPYQAGDLQGAFLVISATDNPTVNHQVWEEARALGCLINVVDDPEHSNFILPAVVRRREVTIGISTGGGSPALARRIREQLQAEMGEEIGLLAHIMAELRPELLKRYPPGEPRLQAALKIVDSDILDVIQNQGISAGWDYARQMLEQSGGALEKSRRDGASG